MTYHIDAENRVILIQGRGTVTDEEMIACIGRMRNDPDLPPDTPALCDMRGIEAKITRGGMQRLVTIMSRTDERRGAARAAAIVDDPVSFGMGRAFAALTDRIEPEFRVFEDADAAHAWLGAG